MKYLIPVLLAIPTFAPLQRTSREPILKPQGDGFESAGVFNPAVIMYNGKFVMLCSGQTAYHFAFLFSPRLPPT